MIAWAETVYLSTISRLGRIFPKGEEFKVGGQFTIELGNRQWSKKRVASLFFGFPKSRWLKRGGQPPLSCTLSLLAQPRSKESYSMTINLDSVPTLNRLLTIHSTTCTPAPSALAHSAAVV
jgi:hypothetical protein